VLTINSRDPSKEFVADWMRKRNYYFTVLWGGTFHKEVGVEAFPTTWIVDREGDIVFEVVGGTDRFAQENQWRVESILYP
jgi:hypothetical protein